MSIRPDRRAVILAGLGAAAWAGGARAQGAGDLSLRLDLPGRALLYRQSEARNLGDFAGPAYTQQCFVAMRPEAPFTVFFRPDKDSARVEVVVELGRIFGAANAAAASIGGYRATISRGDSVLAQVDVPKHNWFGRWRWQSAPRPIAVSPAELIAVGLLPPYRSGVIRLRPGGQYGPGYTIMGAAGVAQYMPTTGERDDIGLITEPQAEYVITGSAIARAAMMAQAEASGSVPWHMRDETAGGPVNFEKNPKLFWRPEGNVKIAKTDWEIDTAHQPALTYLPYLLTGDPYYLEALQFACTWNFGMNSPEYRNYKDCVLGGYPYTDVGQSRAWGWSIRTLAYAIRATPESVPAWLLPRAYWKTKLDANRAWFTMRFVENKAGMYRTFRSTASPWYIPAEGAAYPGNTSIDPWQDYFQGAVYEQMLRMGFAEWKPIADWKSGLVIGLNGANSGWNRNTGTPYRLKLRNNDKEPWVDSFAAAWALNTPMLGNPTRYTSKDPTYDVYARGYLAMLKARNVPGAAEAFAWLDGALSSIGAAAAHKWSLG